MGAAYSQDAQGIHQAVANTDVAKLEELINALKQSHKKVAEYICAPDLAGRTSLHLAAERNSLTCASKLLEHGAPVNSVSLWSHKTPLYYATRHGDAGMDLTTLLLENGACPFIPDKHGHTPIEKACEAQAQKMMRSFVEKAKWRGKVLVEVNSWHGMSSTFKLMYVVLVPFKPSADTTRDHNQQHRLQLWMFNDEESIRPRARPELNGVQVLQEGDTIMLRLHESYSHPGGGLAAPKVYGRYCVRLKGADQEPIGEHTFDQLNALLKEARALEPVKKPEPKKS